MAKLQKTLVLTALALCGAMLSACGGRDDPGVLRERLNDQILRVQLAVRTRAEDAQQRRIVEQEAAEQEAIAQAEVQAEEAAAAEARVFEERRAAAAEAASKQNPYAGRPAEQMSNQFHP
jgi:hypothetical protein